METQCCPVMDLQWTPRLVEDQYADVYFCASCGHVHRTEKYATNLRFPYHDRCVNCGGDLDEERCTFCGLTPEEDKALHDRYASLHPERDYMAASQALTGSGRYVLALKLATAQTRWGGDPVAGEVQRLSVLESMNEFDRALDEAYEWADNPGCPPVVFGVIAGLEANLGNLTGALAALERGLAKEPARYDWWIDYAELNMHMDERANALRAAAKALPSESVQERAIAVMAEVGERYYASGQYAAALSACSLAQDLQERYVELAWLRARIAANHQDSDYMIRWLETTVALDPDHDEALAMLAPYQRKTGWFRW